MLALWKALVNRDTKSAMYFLTSKYLMLSGLKTLSFSMVFLQPCSIYTFSPWTSILHPILLLWLGGLLTCKDHIASATQKWTWKCFLSSDWFPPDNKTRTVLLPAVDWKFPLTLDIPPQYSTVENDPSQNVPFPPLAGLLDALIECWLDCPSDDSMLLIGLACQIFYLHTYYELQEFSVSWDSEGLFYFLGGVNGKPTESDWRTPVHGTPWELVSFSISQVLWRPSMFVIMDQGDISIE